MCQQPARAVPFGLGTVLYGLLSLPHSLLLRWQEVEFANFLTGSAEIFLLKDFYMWEKPPCLQLAYSLGSLYGRQWLH